jgi:Fur family ferric uptake transcriptional regulator
VAKITMENYNQLEKANFKALIESDGQDELKERLDILGAFLNTEEHITLEEFCLLLEEKGYQFDPGFVKQCLNRMVGLGFAQKKHFEGQPIRYEHRHLGKHHDHLVCTKCGTILEFANEDMERLQVEISVQYGFHMLQHRMDLYGICSRCLKRRKPLMPLAMANSREQIVIREITVGSSKQRELQDMGLRTGNTIEVINNTGRGRIILAHGQTRIAIGRGIAQKIMVSLADTEGDHDEP